MTKDTTNPTAFDSLLSDVYGNPEGAAAVSNMDAQNEFTDPVVDNTKPTDKPVEEPKADDTKPSNNDDDSQIPQDVLDRMNNNSNDKPTENNSDDTNDNINTDPSEDQLIEAQQVGALFDAIGQSFGWNMDDIDEKDRPLTVENLTDYMRDVVRQNSKPVYADERIEKLDEYVKNGGRFEDFYSKQQEQISYDNIDMEDEANQKAIVSELLKYSGYTDEQIKNKISRYEDADMLEEESEDALERLKQIRQKQIEYSEQQQAEYIKQQEEQSRKFYTDCTSEINSLTNIRGVQIPKEDRAKLIDYIFNVDQDGISKFQKDYNNQDKFITNLITTAYMTMKGDSFISTAKKDGESSATEKLRKILRHSSRNHSTYNADEKPKSVIDLASRFF